MNTERALEILGLDWPRNRKLICPAHEDRTGSLHLYDNDFYCFSCARNGDSYGLIALFTGKPVKDVLAQYKGPEAPGGSSVPKVTEQSMRKDIELRFVLATQPLYDAINAGKDTEDWQRGLLTAKASVMTDSFRADLREATPYQAEMLLRNLDKKIAKFRTTWHI